MSASKLTLPALSAQQVEPWALKAIAELNKRSDCIVAAGLSVANVQRMELLYPTLTSEEARALSAAVEAIADVRQKVYEKRSLVWGLRFSAKP